MIDVCRKCGETKQVFQGICAKCLSREQNDPVMNKMDLEDANFHGKRKAKSKVASKSKRRAK